MANAPAESVRAAADYLTTMAELGRTLSTPERERLQQVLELFEPDAGGPQPPAGNAKASRTRASGASRASAAKAPAKRRTPETAARGGKPGSKP